MRGPRFRTLASQITILTAVPLTMVLVMVAALALYSNQKTRLDGFLRSDSEIAKLLVRPAQESLDSAAAPLVDAGRSSSLPAYFKETLVIRPGAVADLELPIDPEFLVRVKSVVERALDYDRAIYSAAFRGPTADSRLIAVAVRRPDGNVSLGIINADLGLGGADWRRYLADTLPAPPASLDIALADPSGRFVFHSNSDRIGQGLDVEPVTGAAGTPSVTGSLVRNEPDYPSVINAYAALGDSGWTVVTERSWNPWVEAVSGFGVLIVAPLLVAALLPVFLIGLSARRITRPIRQLDAYAERIAAGDFRGSPLLTRTGDEVEELAMRFDSMAGQLNSLYDSLEKRVDDRTAELLSVLSLARSVSQTFECREIADISRDLLRAHPNISDAMLWIDSTADGSLDLQSTAPDWVVSLPDPSDSLLSADSGAPVERPRILAEQGPSGMVYVLPVDFRESSAYLGVQLGADEIDDDLVRYLEAVAAQVAVALEGSVLYGRARTAAATEERNRLAREIHDTLAQSITGVIVQLEALRGPAKSGQDSQRIQWALDLAREGLREARRSVQGLRASVLEANLLDRAIAEDVERLDRTGGLQARFGTIGDAALIPPNVASELYRIAEEALTNVQRHSGAQHVLINLHVDEEGTRLVVEDDGVGFDAATGKLRGHGLIGMRERAANIGGKVRLESEPGEGTRVQVFVPNSERLGSIEELEW